MKIFLLKEVNARNHSNWIALGVFFIALATALFGFFERYPLYHDEMINTFKAEIGLVFDYALRPLTYALNHFAYEFFGSSPKSLLLIAAIMYAFTGLNLYLVGRRHFTIWVGLLCASLFLASPLIIYAGIRSMPHIYSAAFSSLTLLVFSKLWTEQDATKSTFWAAFSGLCCVLTVSTHPTMLGMFVVFMAWAISGLAIRKYIFSSLFPENISNRSLSIMFVSGSVAFLILNVIYKVEYGSYYTDILNSGFSKIDQLKFDSYKEPWYAYLIMIADRHKFAAYFSVICVAIILPISLFKNRFSKLLTSDNHNVAFTLLVSLFSIGFLASLSLASWKFDRILVGYFPIMMLSIGLILGSVFKISSQFLPHKAWTFLCPLFILGLIFSNYSGLDRSLDAALNKKRDVYYRIYEILNSLEDDTINLITNNVRKEREIKRYTKFSQLSVIPIQFDENAQKNQVFLDALESSIRSGDTRYTLIDTELLDQVVTSQEQEMPFSHWLRAIGAQSLYSSLGRIELWVIEDTNYGVNSAIILANLQSSVSGKRIAVINGSNILLGDNYQQNYRQVVDALRKTPYRLNIMNRDAVTAAGYLDRNKVNIIALSKNIEPVPADEKIRLLTEYLSSNGWAYEVSLSDLSLDIWVRSK
jgi:hypothetical protein